MLSSDSVNVFFLPFSLSSLRCKTFRGFLSTSGIALGRPSHSFPISRTVPRVEEELQTPKHEQDGVKKTIIDKKKEGTEPAIKKKKETKDVTVNMTFLRSPIVHTASYLSSHPPHKVRCEVVHCVVLALP